MKTAIVGGIIYTPFEIQRDSCVIFHKGKIEHVGRAPENLSEYDVIRSDGFYIFPGLIDLQVNGGGGLLFVEAKTEVDLDTISEAHAKTGTTSILATTITMNEVELTETLNLLGQYKRKETHKGAQIVGVHMEGPFLNPQKRGGHTKDHLLLPSITTFQKFEQAALNEIKIVGIAPELIGALELIEYLRSKKIRATLAHSEANYDCVYSAVLSGLDMASHLYNAMDQLGNREPSTVGAILSMNAISAGIICDLKHVHPAAIKIAVKVKGAEKLFIVTDAVSPLGTGLRKVKLYGHDLEVKDGACFTEDGTLAGSVTTMLEAIKNLTQVVGTSLIDALIMATINPARQIGVDDMKGSLSKGKDADIIICDQEFRLKAVFLKGRAMDLQTSEFTDKKEVG